MTAAYPSANAPLAAIPGRNQSGHTAESMVLIALILQILGGVLVLGGIGWFFGFSILHPYPWSVAALAGASVVAILVILFLYFAYSLSYRRIQSGRFEDAQTPTLVIGILSLFFGVLPGVFYLIGYVKLGDAVQESRTAGAALAGFVPGSLVACRSCGKVLPSSSYAFCPFCAQRIGPVPP